MSIRALSINFKKFSQKIVPTMTTANIKTYLEKRPREEEAADDGEKKTKIELSTDHPYIPDSQYKFISWNVNGFNALWKKDKGKWLKDLIEKEQPTCLGLQETKLQKKNEDSYAHILDGYTAHFNSCTAKKGYSGTAVYIRKDIKPISISHGINVKKHDDEGRMITVELPEYYFITSYGKIFMRKMLNFVSSQQWSEIGAIGLQNRGMGQRCDFISSKATREKTCSVVWRS
jgi:hypothetical protein